MQCTAKPTKLSVKCFDSGQACRRRADNLSFAQLLRTSCQATRRSQITVLECVTYSAFASYSIAAVTALTGIDGNRALVPGESLVEHNLAPLLQRPLNSRISLITRVSIFRAFSNQRKGACVHHHSSAA